MFAWNSTESFIKNFIIIYSKVCRIKENEFEDLLENLKVYSDFVNKCNELKYLDIIQSKERKIIIATKKINDFKKTHLKFENIIFRDGIDFSISSEDWKSYLINKLLLEKTEIAKTYNDYILWEDHTRKTPQKIYFHNIPIDYISNKKEEIKKQKLKLPKNRKLLKKEINYIRDSTLPYLEEYQKWAEKYFFSIKSYLRYYNKRVKIILTNDKILFMPVFLENSNELNLEIDPIIPSVNPSLSSILSQKGFHMLSMPLNLNKVTNYCRISKKEIFYEVLEIFFNVANENDIVDFFKKVFSLLGFQYDYIENNLFQLKKINYQIEKENPLKIESKKRYFLLNKSHLYDAELVKVLKQIGKLRTKFGIKDKIYLFTFSDYSLLSVNNDIKKANIIKISSRQLSNLLFKSDLYYFLNTFIQDIILSKKKSKVNALLARKSIGDNFINELGSVKSGHKNFKKFETLVNNIFEYLFKDSFRQYFAEPHSVDYEGHQIRDLIISNISPIKDFWKERKKEQNAKQIVVDAKNYTTEITKSEINDVSQYLNKKLGNFAIIVSRKEISRSGKKEQKLKYADDKLIIHLSQNDIISLISHKIHQEEIEDLLEKKIHNIIK